MAISVKYGDSGTNAKIVQQMLRRNGYVLDADGKFGDSTLKALNDYQRKNGYAVTNYVDQNMWDTLSGSLAKSAQNGTYAAAPEPITNTRTPGATISSDGKFNYKSYAESPTVQEAWALLNQHLGKTPTYTSPHGDQLQKQLEKILAGEDFKYDINGDALYQQYKDIYTNQAKMGAADVMGQASAMTGGYGNSYAQTAGPQMYHQQMQGLNEMIPELYQMALDKHNAEQQKMYDEYSLLADAENREYSKYVDEYNKWLTDRDYLANKYYTEKENDYNEFLNERNYEYGVYSDNREYEYAKDRDVAADNLASEKALYDYKEALMENGYMLDKDGNIVPIQEEVVVDDSVSEEDIKNDLAAFGFSKENRTKVESYLNDLMATDPPTILPTEKKEYLEWWDEEVKANK
jgi:hypothetical protein